MNEKLIDLSHINSHFEMSQLSPEIAGVISKGTQGASFKDDTFNPRWQVLKGLDKARGVYHYLTNADPKLQADNFLSLGVDFSKPGVLPPIVDVEEDINQATPEILREYLNAVEAATGRKPMIYTYKSFWLENNFGNGFSDYPLWVASYQTKLPGMFGGWAVPTLWQYGQRGSYRNDNDGGDVDYSRCCVDLNSITNR